MTRAGQHVLLAFMTLAALIAMHGVGTHDGPAMAGMSMGQTAAQTSAATPAKAAMSMDMATIPDLTTDAATLLAGTPPTVDVAFAGHEMPMGACLAVLTGSLLLSALAMAAARRRRQASGIASATHALDASDSPHRPRARDALLWRRLAPTVTQLCILQA